MAADASQVRQNYVFALQAACKAVQQLNQQLTNLANLYAGDGLSGTFVDSEFVGVGAIKHLVAADVGTFTANLNTIQAAMSAAIIQNMAKAVGNSI